MPFCATYAIIYDCCVAGSPRLLCSLRLKSPNLECSGSEEGGPLSGDAEGAPSARGPPAVELLSSASSAAAFSAPAVAAGCGEPTELARSAAHSSLSDLQEQQQQAKRAAARPPLLQMSGNLES